MNCYFWQCRRLSSPTERGGDHTKHVHLLSCHLAVPGPVIVSHSRTDCYLSEALYGYCANVSVVVVMLENGLMKSWTEGKNLHRPTVTVSGLNHVNGATAVTTARSNPCQSGRPRSTPLHPQLALHATESQCRVGAETLA